MILNGVNSFHILDYIFLKVIILKKKSNQLLMRLFFEIVFSGVYSEYSWLKKEYESYYSIPKKYNELFLKRLKELFINIKMI